MCELEHGPASSERFQAGDGEFVPELRRLAVPTDCPTQVGSLFFLHPQPAHAFDVIVRGRLFEKFSCTLAVRLHSKAAGVYAGKFAHGFGIAGLSRLIEQPLCFQLVEWQIPASEHHHRRGVASIGRFPQQAQSGVIVLGHGAPLQVHGGEIARAVDRAGVDRLLEPLHRGTIVPRHRGAGGVHPTQFGHGFRIPGVGALLKPMQCLRIVALHAHAAPVGHTDAMHALGCALLCGRKVPSIRLPFVSLDAPARGAPAAHFVHCPGISGFGRLAIPTRRGRRILLDTLAQVEHPGQVEHRVCTAFLSRPEEHRPCRVVLLSPVTLERLPDWRGCIRSKGTARPGLPFRHELQLHQALAVEEEEAALAAGR